MDTSSTHVYDEYTYTWIGYFSSILTRICNHVYPEWKGLNQVGGQNKCQMNIHVVITHVLMSVQK